MLGFPFRTMCQLLRSATVRFGLLGQHVRPPTVGHPPAALSRLPSISQTHARDRRLLSTSAAAGSSSKALITWDEIRQLRSSPRPALLLGAAGLVPFAAAPALMLSSGAFSPELLHAQLAYGACILSFLGGVRWGLTLPEGAPQPPDWRNLGQAVAPSLVAWAGLLTPPAAGSLFVMAGLGVAAYWDVTLYGYPGWFKALRFCLSVGAILAMWTVLMCKWFLAERPAAGKAEK